MLDNMVLSYLVEAMAVDYDPGRDDEALASERVAALRLFLWADVSAGETAVKQSQRTRDEAWRRKLERLLTVQLPETLFPDEGREWLANRVAELNRYHGDVEDCQVVAEAEGVRATGVVSFDKIMMKRLSPHATVPILFPSEHWAELGIERGTPPRWTPAPGNWLANRSWWPW